MAKSMLESKVRDRLKRHFKKKGFLLLDGRSERRLPLPRKGTRSCQPDVIACSKNGGKLFIVECKKVTRPRLIGHAFGQLFVDEIIIKRIKKKEWIKFLKKRINPKIKHAPEIVYGVAFPLESKKDVLSKRIIKNFTRRFSEYRVYYIGSKKVSQVRNVV